MAHQLGPHASPDAPPSHADEDGTSNAAPNAMAHVTSPAGQQPHDYSLVHMHGINHVSVRKTLRK
eukprot:2469713-Amphidinium_carterae.1